MCLVLGRHQRWRKREQSRAAGLYARSLPHAERELKSDSPPIVSQLRVLVPSLSLSLLNLSKLPSLSSEPLSAYMIIEAADTRTQRKNNLIKNPILCQFMK